MGLEDAKSGDLIALSKPGRPWKIGHVGIVAPVLDTHLVYEFTMDERPACVRTRREDPKGMQAHRPIDVIDTATRAWLVPLNRPLFPQEEDRLLETLEDYLGHGPEYLRDGHDVAGGPFCRLRQWLSPTPYLAAEVVQLALIMAGLYSVAEIGGASPSALIADLCRKGIYRKPQLIT